jgi:hypothetical protein
MGQFARFPGVEIPDEALDQLIALSLAATQDPAPGGAPEGRRRLSERSVRSPDEVLESSGRDDHPALCRGEAVEGGPHLSCGEVRAE